MDHVEAVAGSIYLKIIETYSWLVVPKHHINMWIRNSTLLVLFGEFLKTLFWKIISPRWGETLNTKNVCVYTFILLHMNKLANI